jgi:predicted phage-related endonuclease
MDIDIIDIPIHVGIMTKIRKESLAMWKRIETKEAPPADFKKDAETIAVLYPQDSGATIDLSSSNRIVELVDQRDKLKARESDGGAAERERKAIDTEIKAIMGEAAYGRLADGRVIVAKTQKRQNKAREAFESVFRTITIKDGVDA